MKKWSVKSKGRLEKIIIFYFFLTLIIMVFLLNGAGGSDAGFFAVFLSFLFWLPISLPLLIIPLKKLLTSKIPKEIVFDDYGNIVIIFGKRAKEVISLANLAFSHSPLTGSSVSLTFYKTFLGSRGQTVYKEVIQVVALKWTFSWRIEQLKGLIEHLDELGIEKKYSSNENLSLFDKLSS